MSPVLLAVFECLVFSFISGFAHGLFPEVFDVTQLWLSFIGFQVCVIANKLMFRGRR